jgi:hypothetical protein
VCKVPYLFENSKNNKNMTNLNLLHILCTYTFFEMKKKVNGGLVNRLKQIGGIVGKC